MDNRSDSPLSSTSTLVDSDSTEQVRFPVPPESEDEDDWDTDTLDSASTLSSFLELSTSESDLSASEHDTETLDLTEAIRMQHTLPYSPCEDNGMDQSDQAWGVFYDYANDTSILVTFDASRGTLLAIRLNEPNTHEGDGNHGNFINIILSMRLMEDQIEIDSFGGL